MFCPQCGTESASGQQYCRSCGANLKVIGKAVTLSEAIARSDRGPLPKIKEMMKSLKVEHVTEEVSHALDQMNKEIVRSSPPSKPGRPWWLWMKHDETPEQRREKHIVQGTISLFSGVALMIVLYYFCGALVLKLPPEWLAKIPFELEPVVRIFWLIGLIPTLSGLGRITAGLLIRPRQVGNIAAATQSQQSIAAKSAPKGLPGRITEHTTELLDREVPPSRTNEVIER